MINILLTGITGFVGSHMADYILKNVPDSVIYATRRWRSRDENIAHFYGNERVKFIEADLLDRGSLNDIITLSKPDYVFHFAAQSFPRSSFNTPVYTLTNNIIGTTNLLDELRIAKQLGVCDPIIVSISSSEVYGNPLPNEVPITEKNPIRAANPYSISKVGHDLMSQYFYNAYGLKIIVTRMFSHEGSRRGKQFALSSFAWQIVKHEKTHFSKITGEPLIDFAVLGQFLPIQVGNLNSVRTYAHISDAVHAYWLAATKGKVGEVYNIGGNYTCTVGEALNNLISKSIINAQHFKIIVDQDRIRPTDITLQIPSFEKFKNDTGWSPTKDLNYINDDLLNYWRQVL
jgi:GDP-D-mannose dehydratase